MGRNSWRLGLLSYYADFALVPVYIAVAFALALAQAEPSGSWALLFLTGAFVWTFIEYWMHRTVFHRFLRLEHAMHHLNPLALVATPPWITGLVALLVWLFAVSALNGVGRGAALFAGLATGYYGYSVLHTLIHQTTGGLRYWRAAHETHHKIGSRNFGVSTMLWDKLFGTYHHDA